jgi:hypothetical protein
MNLQDERKAVVLIHDIMSVALKMSSSVPYQSPVHDELSKLVKRILELGPYVEFFGRSVTVSTPGTTLANRRASDKASSNSAES